MMLLSNNPFYLLHISPTATKEEIDIAAHTTAIALELDPETIISLQNLLSDPDRRLEAEMRWFLDASSDKEEEIFQSISEQAKINHDGLPPYSRLIASIYNCTLETDQDAYDLGYEAWDLDKQFFSLNTSYVVDVINRTRAVAGIPLASSEAVEKGLMSIRTQALQGITEKILPLDLNDYCDMMSILADRWNESNSMEGIIDDLLEQYEAMTQVLSDQHTGRVMDLIDTTKNCSIEEIPSRLSALSTALKEWSNIVYPVQVRCCEREKKHNNSDKLANALDSMVRHLLIERKYRTGIVEFCKECQTIFAPLKENAEKFVKIEQAIQNALNSVQISPQIREQVRKNIAQSKQLLNSKSDTDIGHYLGDIMVLNQLLLRETTKKAEANSLRGQICQAARDLAISLAASNELDYSDSIYTVLLSCFSDLEKYNSLLRSEQNAIQQRNGKNRSLASMKNNDSSVPHEGSDKNWKQALIGLAVLLIMIFGVFYFADHATIRPSPVNKDIWTTQKYDDLAKNGDKVYIRIKSIFPSYGVYNENSVNYDHFICECVTTENETIYLYITVQDYKNHFDKEATASKLDETWTKEITLNGLKIYGYVKRTTDIGVKGLLSKIEDKNVVVFYSVG